MSDAQRGSATTFRVNADATQASNELQRFQGMIGELNGNLAKLNSQFNNVNVGRFGSRTRQTTREVTRFSSTMRSGFGALAAFNTFTSTASGLLSGAFVFAVASAGTNLIKLGAQAESTRERFLALSETIDDGRRRFEEFADFADERGIQFRGLVEAANQLRVVGFAGEELDTFIRQIGIVAGDSLERVQRITRALGQMRAFGRVALEELNQLTEAGVPIVAALADELQVDEGQIRGLIELGRIDFADVRNSFAALADESGAFFAASEAQSETLQGSINRLNNAMFMFADELNMRTGPGLQFLVEAGAGVLEFFSSFEGVVLALSVAFGAVLIPAIGGLVQLFAASLPNSIDPLIQRIHLLNFRYQVAASRVGILRRQVVRLGFALRAAFSPFGIALTAIATVALPVIISRFERLRREAQELADALKSLETADPGTITEDLRPELFEVAQREIRNIERELVGVNAQGAQFQAAWQHVTDQIRAGEGNIRDLQKLQEQYNFSLGISVDRAVELETRLRQIRVAIGERPPAAELPDFNELAQEGLLALRDAIRERVEGRAGEFVQTVEFAPELRERELVQIISFIRKEIEGVVQLASEGFNFLPDGDTITFLRGLLQDYNAQLEALRDNSRRALTPAEELQKILERNAEALITLGASIDAGITDASERFQRETSINREAIRDLIVLRQQLANLENVDPEFLSNLDTIINDFRSQLPTGEPIGESLFEAIFDPRGRASDDIVLGFDKLFTTTERLLRQNVDDLLEIIRSGRAAEDVNFFDSFTGGVAQEEDLSISMQRQIRQETYNALLEHIDQQHNIIQSGLHDIEVIQINYTDTLVDEQGKQVRAYNAYNSNIGSSVNQQSNIVQGGLRGAVAQHINYTAVLTEEQEKQLDAYASYGNEIGVYILDQAEMLRELEEITEQEYAAITGIVGSSAEEVAARNEELQRSLDRGFVFEVPPQARAIANFILTLGEAIVSVTPTFDNIKDAVDSLFDSIDQTGPQIINLFNAIAGGISLFEQPILAGQDALISFTDDYASFVENIVNLSVEQREAFFNAFPPEFAEQLRAIVRDYEEVYARVGDAFDADAFRILPDVIQDALEEAYNRFQGAEPTLRALYAEVVDLIEEENITLSERTRRFGLIIANNLSEPAIQYGMTIANLVGIFTGAIQVADSSFAAFTEIAGGLGEFLGVGRERVIQFVEAADRFLTTGNDTIILAERIGTTVNSFAISSGVNFGRLLINMNDTEEAFSRVAQRGLQLNAVFRQAAAETGNYEDNLGMISSALNIAEADATDAGFALLGLASAGGNLAGLIAPGLGIVAEQVNNVVNATADAIAVRRVLSTVPSFIRNVDLITLQSYIEELENYEDSLDQAAEANRELRMSAGTIEEDLAGRGLSVGAEAARDYLAALTALSPLLQSEAFNAFLEGRGFERLPGLSVLETIELQISNIDITTEAGQEAVDELSELFGDVIFRQTVAFVDSLLDGAVTVARAWTSTLSTIADTITHNANIVIEEQQRILEELREQRREEEMDIMEQLDRELEGLRRQLDADLVTLTNYYDQVDELQRTAEGNINMLKEAEVKKENDIQQARYEAELNSFNIRKAVAIAEIAINTAVAIIQALAQLGPIAGAIAAGAIGAAGAVQAGLVFAQSAPSPPPEITLQRGGIVNSATRALIGEGGSPEAVIPLDRYEYRRRGEGSGDGMVVNYYIEGNLVREHELSRTLRRDIGREQRTGRVRAFQR